MGRPLRLFVLDYPHHVVQRGHNGEAVFRHRGDYCRYLGALLELKREFQVDLLGYCLMTNHVHLILMPRADATALSGLMHRLAGQYAQWVNRREGRIGALWSQRFFCSVIDTDAYLLACLRYVDLNPVRARLVSDPARYLWSGYAERTGQRPGHTLDPDPITSQWQGSDRSRRRAYAEFVNAGGAPNEIEFLRTATYRNRPIGSRSFVERIVR